MNACMDMWMVAGVDVLGMGMWMAFGVDGWMWV